MPRAKWSIGADEPDDLEPFAVYDGPDVPAGVYKVKLKRMTLVENSSGDEMLKVLVEIDEDGDKKKYNGFGLWGNQNITEVGARFLKAMLKSFGWTWQEFMAKTVLEHASDRPTSVLQIGRIKIESEPEARVQVKIGSYNGEPQRQIGQWLPPKDDDDEPYDADADPDADDADPFK